MTADYPVYYGGAWHQVAIPTDGGEPIAVPIIAGLVFADERRSSLLLQRRDRPGEPTRGLWEIPMGRWRAGREPFAELAREVAEETGLSVVHADIGVTRYEAHEGRPYLAMRPVAVTIGIEGSFPSLHLVFPCVATGTPRPEPGHTIDPTWFAVAHVEQMLGEPAQFTGPTHAILSEWLGYSGSSSVDEPKRT